MDITRQTFAGLVAGLYVGGGILLLCDFLIFAPEVTDPAPLALHVWPLSAGGAWIASLTPVHVSSVVAALGRPAAYTLVYIPALLTCTVCIWRLVAGKGRE